MARGASSPSFLPPNLRNPVNSCSNIFKVFPVDMHRLISHVQLDSLLLLLSRARQRHPTVSKPGRGSHWALGSPVRLFPCSSACQPRRGREGEGGGGRGAELRPAPGRWHQAAEQMPFDECVRTCHVLRWQRGWGQGRVTWGELMMMRCSHYAAQRSSISYHFPVSALLARFFYFPNKLEHIRPELD